MDDSTNDDKFAGKQNEYYEKNVTELFEEKELKIKWHKEILENDSMQEYFKNFNPHSIDTFISFYLAEKYLAYKYADSYQRRADTKRSRWIDAAEKHLKIIQHKKMFDAQCLWRAEQIQLEGVAISFDFRCWIKDILNCPFIEAVTEDDIRMYQDYLATTDFDYRDDDDFHDMQNYDRFRENYHGDEDEGTPLPDWYDYHNLRTGNSSLLLLPDIRGEKEDFYIELFRDDACKDAPPPAPYVPDTRGILMTSDIEKMTFFVKTFEDEETRVKYGNYLAVNKKQEDTDFDLGDLLYDLKNEEEVFPIAAHHDYREALFKAYNSFYAKKLAEYLPIAHQQYLFNRQMGLITKAPDNFYLGLRGKYLNMILDGRALNGEPRNLDF